MKTISEALHPLAEPWMKIILKFLEIDRYRGDSRLILDCTTNKIDYGYEVGTISGILKWLQFSVCPEKIISFEDSNKWFQLRTVAIE